MRPLTVTCARVASFALLTLILAACVGGGGGGGGGGDGDGGVDGDGSNGPSVSPWLTQSHSGEALAIDVKGPTQAEITWTGSEGEAYDLYITRDIETELGNYSVYGAELLTNVSAPVLLDDLVEGEPVYVALKVNDELQDWSSFSAKVAGLNNDIFRVNAVRTQAFGADGTRYVGGSFDQANLVTGSGVGFPAKLDSPHALAFPEVNGTVYATVTDSNGGWYIGGAFTEVGNEERLRLAHVDHAGRLTSWNPGADDTVHALTIADDVIYAGGDFSSVGGETRDHLATLDHAGDLMDWAQQPNGTVRALAVADGVLYAGGDFTEVGGAARDRLAAFDTAGNRTSWSPGADNTVLALATADGVIYAGGFFTEVDGDTRNRLAAFDTEGQLTNWDPGVSSGVYTLAIVDNVIYAGGTFFSAGGGTGETSRSRLAAFDTAGTLLTWNPGDSGSLQPVFAIAIEDGVIYAGGQFRSAGGETRRHLAAFDTDGNLTGWNPGVSDIVRTLSIANGVIYAGGEFISAGNKTRNNLAAFDAAGNLTDWHPDVEAFSSVFTLAMADGLIYAGGSFTEINGQTRNRLAAFDSAGELTGWNPGAENTVNTLAIADGIVYAGGNFTSAGGGTGTITRNRLAAFDTAGNVTDWNPGADRAVRTLAMADGVIYAGGRFTEVNGETRSLLAAIDPDGDLTAWAPGTIGGTSVTVSTLAIADEVIYVGGRFASVNGSTRNNLAAFDNTAGNLTDWNPGVGNIVNTLATAGGVIYAGGRFTSAGGGTGTITRNGLAAFGIGGNLTDWNPGADDVVQALSIVDGVIYAVGEFESAGGGTGNNLRNRLSAFDETGGLLAQ